jgi:two-component system chemotaxis response regulator CheB
MQQGQPIKVLVVEDSAVVRMMLVHILSADAGLEVIGTAANGIEAVEFMKKNAPDVILMDIHMPEMDGFDATRIIMETRPVPIVICSGSCNTREMAVTFRLMEAGAVAIVEKPFGKQEDEYGIRAQRIVETVKLMAEVRVVRRWAHLRNSKSTPAPRLRPVANGIAPTGQPARVLAIGASTGGPPVLQAILSSLPRDFRLPVLVVQHIAAGFLPGLAEWLDQTTGLPTHIATHGQQPHPGHVYLAPDDYHMTYTASGIIALNRRDPEYGLRPSVDQLFRSIAETIGGRGIGVLLTGMGRDGAMGLLKMHEAGAWTIAQDRETSVVHGMPGAAIELGAASQILPSTRIAAALTALIENENNSDGEGS